MGESYRIPGRQCLVDEFVRLERTAGQSAWKAYCDCNFLEPVETTIVKVGGTVLPKPPFMTDAAFAQMVRTNAAQKNLPVTVEVKFTLRRTEEWTKCVNKFCALATGCWNNDSNDWMPFNVHPGAALAPWTDLGAAARGIYKKDAGFFYTVGQVFSIDLKAYQPLTMWRNFFENPPVYWLNVTKLNFIPGVGTAIAAAVASSTPTNLVLLLPLALAQAAAEQKSAMQYVFKPMVLGSVKYAAFCLRAVPALFAQNYFEFAGLLAARFCQDQLDTGEIDKVYDPFTRAVIVFFAKTGEEIGRKLQEVITGGFNLSSAPGVISVLIAGFDAVATLPNIDVKVRDFARSAANVLRVVRTIAEGIQQKAPPFAIVDKVVFEVFGFSLDQLRQAVKQGAGEVQRLLNVAREKGKEGTIDGALKAFDAILAAFSKISDTITFINNAIGGGLEKFREQFSGFSVVLGEVKTETSTLLNQTIEASVHPAQPATSSRQPGVTGTSGNVVPVGGGAKPATASTGSSTASVSSALMGAGVGAVAGGPVGAAVGALVGLALTPSSKASPALVQAKQEVMTTRAAGLAARASKALGFGDFITARRYGVLPSKLTNPLAQRTPSPAMLIAPPPVAFTLPLATPSVAPPAIPLATPRTGPIVPDTSRVVVPTPAPTPAPAPMSAPMPAPALQPAPASVPAPLRLPTIVQRESSPRILPQPSVSVSAPSVSAPSVGVEAIDPSTTQAAQAAQTAQAAPQAQPDGLFVLAGLLAMKLFFF